jgi:hypothetical protein
MLKKVAYFTRPPKRAKTRPFPSKAVADEKQEA